jgi:hypothetical protein
MYPDVEALAPALLPLTHEHVAGMVNNAAD